MTSKRDSLGRPLQKQQTPHPRWPEPYGERSIIAGYRLIKYLGFRYTNKNGKSKKKGQHWYLMECMTCHQQYERVEGGISRAISKETRGCMACARKRFVKDKEERRRRDLEQMREAYHFWLWANFLMPVTALRWRDEEGRSFDSEKSKVMGWGLI